MQNDIPKYLEDNLFCISRIKFHIKDIKSFNEFKDAWTIYDAVERRLATICEAVWQINKLDNNFKLTDKN
jgi:uncharacterized protein with HEPN domain